MVILTYLTLTKINDGGIHTEMRFLLCLLKNMPYNWSY